MLHKVIRAQDIKQIIDEYHLDMAAEPRCCSFFGSYTTSDYIKGLEQFYKNLPNKDKTLSPAEITQLCQCAFDTCTCKDPTSGRKNPDIHSKNAQNKLEKLFPPDSVRQSICDAYSRCLENWYRREGRHVRVGQRYSF